MKEYRIKNKANMSYRLRSILQKRIVATLKGHYKSESTIELLGCSIEEFKTHLESQFHKDSRMNWETYGPKGWHIDHIIPCASFNLSDPEQQKICFHYTNMQPLWWDLNIAKSNKIL